MSKAEVDQELFDQLDNKYQESWTAFDEKYSKPEPGENGIVHAKRLETLKSIYIYETFGKKPNLESPTGVLQVIQTAVKNSKHPEASVFDLGRGNLDNLSFTDIVDKLGMKKGNGMWFAAFLQSAAKLPTNYRADLANSSMIVSH